jgi:hypothetical protein
MNSAIIRTIQERIGEIERRLGKQAMRDANARDVIQSFANTKSRKDWVLMARLSMPTLVRDQALLRVLLQVRTKEDISPILAEGLDPSLVLMKLMEELGLEFRVAHSSRKEKTD